MPTDQPLSRQNEYDIAKQKIEEKQSRLINSKYSLNPSPTRPQDIGNERINSIFKADQS